MVEIYILSDLPNKFFLYRFHKKTTKTSPRVTCPGLTLMIGLIYLPLEGGCTQAAGLSVGPTKGNAPGMGLPNTRGFQAFTDHWQTIGGAICSLLWDQAEAWEWERVWVDKPCGSRVWLVSDALCPNHPRGFSYRIIQVWYPEPEKPADNLLLNRLSSCVIQRWTCQTVAMQSRRQFQRFL